MLNKTLTQLGALLIHDQITLREDSCANKIVPDQPAPLGAVWSQISRGMLMSWSLTTHQPFWVISVIKVRLEKYNWTLRI